MLLKGIDFLELQLSWSRWLQRLTSSLSPFMMTQILELMHLSMSSDGMT